MQWNWQSIAAVATVAIILISGALTTGMTLQRLKTMEERIKQQDEIRQLVQNVNNKVIVIDNNVAHIMASQTKMEGEIKDAIKDIGELRGAIASR